jgi:hypothetical protein
MPTPVSTQQPDWNQIHAFLQQMARLREVADWAA